MYKPFKEKDNEIIIIHSQGVQVWKYNNLTDSYYFVENRSKTKKGIIKYLENNSEKFSSKNPFNEPDVKPLTPSDLKVPLWTLGKAVKV